MADTPGDDRTLNDFRRTNGDIDTHHVDVRQAEQTFNELSKTLSRRSTSARKHDSNDSDPEKGEEPFDLRDYLTSSNDASQSAGIKHKHVGVTWEKLQVEGMGSVGSKVCHENTSPYNDCSRNITPPHIDLHREGEIQRLTNIKGGDMYII